MISRLFYDVIYNLLFIVKITLFLPYCNIFWHFRGVKSRGSQQFDVYKRYNLCKIYFFSHNALQQRVMKCKLQQRRIVNTTITTTRAAVKSDITHFNLLPLLPIYLLLSKLPCDWYSYFIEISWVVQYEPYFSYLFNMIKLEL